MRETHPGPAQATGPGGEGPEGSQQSRGPEGCSTGSEKAPQKRRSLGALWQWGEQTHVTCHWKRRGRAGAAGEALGPHLLRPFPPGSRGLSPAQAGGMQAALIPPASWAGALVKAPPSYLFPLGGEQGLRACGRPRRCVSALSDLEGGRPGPAMNTEGAGSLPPRQACLPGYVRSLSGFQECGAAMRPGTTGAALAIPGRGAGEQQSDQDQASRRGRLEGHLPSSARSWL